MLQMYEKGPGAVNLREKVSPRLSTGELATSVKVTVWATTSLLVHTTVVPALMVSVAGSNAKLAMLTFAGAAAGPSPRDVAGGAAAGIELGGVTFMGPAAMFVGAG